MHQQATVPHAATRWQLYRVPGRVKQAARPARHITGVSSAVSAVSCSAAARLPMIICCMLCRLTSDVDAAKADVTKAQRDVEAEKKLKLEANTMLKVRSFSVCCTMVCAYARRILTCLACDTGGTLARLLSQMLHQTSIYIASINRCSYAACTQSGSL